MAWFGKSEEELKTWQDELDSRETSLNEMSRKLQQEEADLHLLDQLQSSRGEDLAKKDAEIGTREKEIKISELNAKNNFVSQQREVFKEAIETQIEQLDQRDNELSQKQKEIEKSFADLKVTEGDIVCRERKVKELELTAENGFADKNQIAMREIEKRENSCVGLEERLQERETHISSRTQELERASEQLRKREELLTISEAKRDEGFTEQRKKLDEEISEKRTEFLQELTNKREKEFHLLENTIQQERNSRLTLLENELAEKQKQYENKIHADSDLLEKKKQGLNQKQADLDEAKDDLEYQKQRLQSRKETLDEREQRLNDEVILIVEERKKSFDRELMDLKDECSRLRDSIKTSNELISNFDELKRKLGEEDPATVLLKLKTYEEDIKSLRQELATRPTQEMQAAFDRITNESEDLKQAHGRLQEENETLRRLSREQSEFEQQITFLTDQNKSLSRRYEAIDADNNRLSDDLRRLQASYEREDDRDARIRDIENPYIQKSQPRSEEKIDELKWLEGINQNSAEYGLKFPKRILHAFHTALKTSEWSPITVLAGVSGTGKSELPRIYSHFGGINFLSLSVQPNWDSQEAMLGFFNSIDNKFDAQPVLRLLAQSQKKLTGEYPYGLEDVMSLILLDEMNLAHVELYFAEFLSKLELRRGRQGNNVPSLEVKLGAGIQHYDLPLGRNVLWAGTMNQDETTKSLSDKVLDRGIVINFPRPTTLERRKQLKALGEQAPLLSRKIWQSWWCKESIFTDEQILPYKHFVEEMNNSLSKVGRALGHRVWQSIEYYLANYPDVLEAQRTNDESLLAKSMKIAFEDQLVQKVMPKLRGIETRGRGKSDCLDKIKSQLINDDYSIVEDFNLACEFGYGQFIWNSANYLKDDEPVVEQTPFEQSPNVSQTEELQSEDSPNVKVVDFGMRASLSNKLLEAGYASKEAASDATAQELKKAGFNMTEVAEIRRALSVKNA